MGYLPSWAFASLVDTKTKNLLKYIGLVTTTSLVLVGCGSEAPPPMPPVAITVVTLDTTDVTLTTELTGRVTSSLVAEVRPQASGIIRERLFTEGALVKAGDPLYQIDDATYKAKVNSAKAALAGAEATLERARLKAKRYRELAKISAVSAQDNDEAIAAWHQAEADVAVAKAELERHTLELGFTRITAPIAGRIGKSLVTQGALVTANQDEALATVQKLDPIYVDVTQTGNAFLQLRQQLAAGILQKSPTVPVTLILEDGSHYGHEGKLAFAEVSVDPTTGSYGLRVEVPNPEHLLLPGMYVRAVLVAGTRPDALLAPQQGIARDPKGNATAMVVNASKQVEVRQVKVSGTYGDQWLVEEGLAVGDRVIVEGLQKIAPGMSVQQVTEAESPTPEPVASEPLAASPAQEIATEEAPAKKDAPVAAPTPTDGQPSEQGQMSEQRETSAETETPETPEPPVESATPENTQAVESKPSASALAPAPASTGK